MMIESKMRFKRLPCLLLTIISSIIIFSINYNSTKCANPVDSSTSKILTDSQSLNASALCPNTSKRYIVPSKQPVNSNYALTLERRDKCNLANSKNCFSVYKSLVITFWSEKTHERWLSSNLTSTFPEQYYDYIVMVHDKSTWHDHPAYDKIIWIHVAGQVKFWYIKRFLSPHIFRAYRYVWVLDDDIRFYFNPLVYECVADKFNILLSSPARGEGVFIYRMTRVSPQFISRIGRWTDFIEIGPMFVAPSSIWICLWNILSEMNGYGFGLDWKWCGILANRCNVQYPINRVCAILDAFVFHHDSTKINTIKQGSKETSAYNQYRKYLTKHATFAAIAPGISPLHSCNRSVFRG